MFDILEINKVDDDITSLLLLGDESEQMIERYIHKGRIFAGIYDQKYVAVCVITIEADGWIEIRNLAVSPDMRRKGMGRLMIAYVESLYPVCKFRLGTGETPSTLRFYKSCGYVYSHRVQDFFTDNYDHPIIEEGVQLRDMLYLIKDRS